MSHCLAEHGIEHVVLERGEIANAWRQERWDSLRLLTPNWQSRLPGQQYTGPDPDGFMSMPEVIGFIAAYAGKICAPVRTATEVQRLWLDSDRYQLATTRGRLSARAVVLANGAYGQPAIPACSESLPMSIDCLCSKEYRNPDRLRDQGVLIVGASATGLQLASEIHRSGRPVTLAVGEHIRLPRSYRGRDVQWWMSESGVLDQRYTDVEDIDRARRVPSPQLIGTPERDTLDLNALQDIGVRLVGRLVGADRQTVQFSGSLANHCAMADLKQNRLLDAFDAWADASGASAIVTAPTRSLPTTIESRPPLSIDLAREGIGTVLWATGLKPDYRWLDLPVFDRRGRLQHEGGVLRSPGSYVMGLPFMRRRKSSYIHGAEDDARELSQQLAAFLDSPARLTSQSA
jgi:putative flavoprotein involved in K+ transport